MTREHMMYVIKVIEEKNYLRDKVENLEQIELEYQKSLVSLDSIRTIHEGKENIMLERIELRDDAIKRAERVMSRLSTDIDNANAEIKGLQRKVNRKSVVNRIMGSGYAIVGVIILFVLL